MNQRSTGTPRIPGLTLGLIGGGQLGRMICIEARRMGIRTAILDPAEHPPAEGLADICIQGSLTDPKALETLAAHCDVLSFEIEHINASALADIEAAGTPVFPSPAALACIQDKLLQKQKFAEAGLPVPRFVDIGDPANMNASQRRAALEEFGLPAVQKARKGGYDGRGVTLLRSISAADADPGDQGLAGTSGMLAGPSMLEEAIDFSCELAVIISRGQDGSISHYPVIEMVFDPDTQICNSVCTPARISDAEAARAIKISIAAVEALDTQGIFAVELFLCADGSLYINEIAPRPHNSGHWTIEGAATSQFAQHVRSVCGLPAGDCSQVKPSVTVNLLGADDATGSPYIDGYEKLLAVPGAYLHWYGKSAVSPQRKMGHFTVLRDNLEDALSIAEELEQSVIVRGSTDGGKI